jgi:DNA-binding GntR family transcriptional regulator
VANTLGIPSIQPQLSIRERVYHNLREAIMNNQIPPATRLVEGNIAQDIGGISRTPVREALHDLEREGLIEMFPRRGYRVKPLDWDEFVQLCEMRTINETLGARWAVDAITPEQIAAMEENLNQAQTEIRSGNPRSFVRYDAEFHDMLITASRSERLLELCRTLRDHMLRYRIGGLQQEHVTLRALSEHRTILECLKQKDKRGVAAAVKTHLRMVKRSMQAQGFKDLKQHPPTNMIRLKSD